MTATLGSLCLTYLLGIIARTLMVMVVTFFLDVLVSFGELMRMKLSINLMFNNGRQ